MNNKLKLIIKNEMREISPDYLYREEIFLDLVEIGQRLKKERLKKRMYQSVVGENLGVNQTAIAGIENGTYNGKYIKLIAKLAKFYKISEKNLLD